MWVELLVAGAISGSAFFQRGSDSGTSLISMAISTALIVSPKSTARTLSVSLVSGARYNPRAQGRGLTSTRCKTSEESFVFSGRTSDKVRGAWRCDTGAAF